MQIASFDHDGRHGFGPVADDHIIDVSATLGRLIDVLGRPDLAAHVRGAATGAPRHAIAAVTLLPPVPNPNRILCVGLNYRSHVAEMGREAGSHPTIFTRYPDSIVGHGEAIVRPRASDQHDFEGELAVVIGRGGRHIAAADAMAAIAGYTVFNDGSVRDWQRQTTQFTPGKNFFRSGACGPWLVTADEIPDIGAETLTTRLNGTIMQQARLDDLIFGVPALIAYLSTVMPLLPGDIIATGTTGGVGAARTPPVWMQPGDTIEIAITGIGTLRNPVTAEA